MLVVVVVARTEQNFIIFQVIEQEPPQLHTIGTHPSMSISAVYDVGETVKATILGAHRVIL